MMSNLVTLSSLKLNWLLDGVLKFVRKYHVIFRKLVEAWMVRIL